MAIKITKTNQSILFFTSVVNPLLSVIKVPFFVTDLYTTYPLLILLYPPGLQILEVSSPSVAE